MRQFINCAALVVCTCLMLYVPAVHALNPSNSGSGKNTYLFIENRVDNEYFITSGSLNPRFTGANVWTRYSTNQRSLGYMGYEGWAYSNYYFDMWLTDSPINAPFLGIRCLTTGNNCPNNEGYIQAEHIDSQGFYHTMSNNSLANGNKGFATFSTAAYEYMRNRAVGSLDAFELNLCYTKTNYDYLSGMRCKDLASGGYWRHYTINATKVGHLTLKSTGALAEVWVASDGTPSVNIGSEHCYVGVVGRVDGLICKLVSYNYQQSATVTNSLSFGMVVDTNSLGFSPKAATIQYSGDGVTWYQHSIKTRYTNVIHGGDNFVYVFLSKTFFNELVSKGGNITNNDALFTFSFTNANTPESGYYQFTASSQVTILPKEYGISIVSADGSSAPSASGNIGDAAPITFDYLVTTSAWRQADAITAQVIGENVTIAGRMYCLFTSPDEQISVPIPAYLSFVSRTGSTVTKSNSCGEGPVDITSAQWRQTPWDSSVDDGFFFSTHLKLLFPMNDTRSNYTVTGEEWMGIVSASGEVKVTAKWIGVN